MIFTSIERTAYHEAGHAVMAMALGANVALIQIKAAGDGTTLLTPLPNDSNLDRVGLALLAASGLAAESLYCDEAGLTTQSGSIGHGKDQEMAGADLSALGHSGMFEEYVALAASILKAPAYWRVVSTIAALLMRFRHIHAPEKLKELCQSVPLLSQSNLSDTLLLANELKKSKGLSADES